MSQSNDDPKPLFLSAEEAMGLLDLCIMSQTDFNRDREGILLKLSDLVREHLAALEEANGDAGKPTENDARIDPQETAPDAHRYADSSHLPSPVVEVAQAPRTVVHRSAMKPCPAGRFRSWIAIPGR